MRSLEITKEKQEDIPKDIPEEKPKETGVKKKRPKKKEAVEGKLDIKPKTAEEISSEITVKKPTVTTVEETPETTTTLPMPEKPVEKLIQEEQPEVTAEISIRKKTPLEKQIGEREIVYSMNIDWRKWLLNLTHNNWTG